MESFQITSEVRAIFRWDLERFQRETRRALERVARNPNSPTACEALEEAGRHAHTLKGLGSMVQAEGLSRWGADLEKLYEAAVSFLPNACDQALEIARFVQEHLDDWERMNELTLENDFAGALAIYLPMRESMRRWDGYLSSVEASVAEAKGQAPEVQSTTPRQLALVVVERPELLAPALRRKLPEGGSELLPPPPAERPIAHASEVEQVPGGKTAARPTLIPPTLLRKNKPAGAGSSGSTPAPAAAPAHNGFHTTASAAPLPAAPAPPIDDELHGLLRDEIAGYVLQLAQLLNALCINAEDLAAWNSARRLFHTIKGSAATVSIDTVASTAREGEQACIGAVESAEKRLRQTVEFCIQKAADIAVHFTLPFGLDAANLPAQMESTGDGSEPTVDPELLSFFTAELLDNARSIEGAVLRWERGETPEKQIATAQRAFHTVKGSANSLGLRALGSSVHEAEAHLVSISSESQPGSPELFAFLLRGVDQLRSYTRNLEMGNTVAWSHNWAAALAKLRTPENEPFQPSHENAPVQGNAPAPQIDSAAEASSAVETDSPVDDRQTLRVENERLHRLFDLAGEMVTDRSRMQKNIERIRALEAQLQERNQTLAQTVNTFQQHFEFNLIRDRRTGGRSGSNGSGTDNASEFSELEFDRYDQFSILSRTLVELAHDVESVLSDMRGAVETFSTDDVRFTQTSRLLQQEITGLGMIPFSSLYPRLQRAFRDACQSVGRTADITFEGADVQVDKVLSDRMHAPLLHLLRNAVAHGIEDSATREARGKSPRGCVRVSTFQSASQIVISLSDDGAGLDLSAIRQRAIERGLLPPETSQISMAQGIELIFRHGFSTSTAVNSVSGRGIGMDVVRQEIEGLNGSIEYTASEGQGAAWIIRLPLSVSISEAIIAECAGLEFAFPLNFVESGAIIDERFSKDETGAEIYMQRGQALPVIRLRELLRLPGTHDATRGIIVAVGGRRAIIVLDRVVARREIVVKTLDVLLRQHPLLTGATLDTDGGVIPILNVPALLNYHDSPASRSPTYQTKRGMRRMNVNQHDGQIHILIVDDSLSVRKVQERLLKSLGCAVTMATDGLDALEKLRADRFDLIFTDLEMPQMNGYELIAEIRSNPAWSSVPTVVISSRGADKYINKAMALGANTFLSKPFTEEQLKALLGHYIGWTSTASIG